MGIIVALWLVCPSRIAVAIIAVTAFFLPPLLIGEPIYPLATVVIEVILGVVLIGVTAAIRKNWTSAKISSQKGQIKFDLTKSLSI